MRSSSAMDTMKTSPRFYIHSIEGKSQTLSVKPSLIATGRWLKLVTLIQKFQIFVFFLPSITDRSEDINKYFKNVSISSIDITQKQLDYWVGCEFNPAKLDLFGVNKTIMSGAVAQCFGSINDISNSNLVRNADPFLSQKEVEVLVKWIGDSKKRVTLIHFKVANWFCFRLLFAWWGLVNHSSKSEVCQPCKYFCNMQKIFNDINTP